MRLLIVLLMLALIFDKGLLLNPSPNPVAPGSPKPQMYEEAAKVPATPEKVVHSPEPMPTEAFKKVELPLELPSKVEQLPLAPEKARQPPEPKPPEAPKKAEQLPEPPKEMEQPPPEERKHEQPLETKPSEAPEKVEQPTEAPEKVEQLPAAPEEAGQPPEMKPSGAPEKGEQPTVGPEKVESTAGARTIDQRPWESEKGAEMRAAEIPGEGDFLDEFAQQLIGFTVEEMQSAPWYAPEWMLYADVNKSVKKLNKYIGDFLDTDYDSYKVLWHTRNQLESLGHGTTTRPKAIATLKTLWQMLGYPHREKLLQLFPAFSIIDKAVERDEQSKKVHK